MDISNKKVLVITNMVDEWEGLSDELIFARQFKEAKVKLLEYSVDAIIFDVVTSGDKEQLLSFIQGLRDHPKLSALMVFVCTGLLDMFGNEILHDLQDNDVTIISGADHFQESSIAPDRKKDYAAEGNPETFETYFSELKESSARSLAKLKMEHSNRGSSALKSREQLVSRYLDILRKESGS